MDSLEDYLKVLESVLSQFLNSGSVSLPGSYTFKATRTSLQFCVPRTADVETLRTEFKNDANPRMQGLVFPDNSVLGVEIEARTYPLPPALKIIEPKIRILDPSDSQPFAYHHKYSFSFFPAKGSKAVKELSAFRYNFHPDTMGKEGDHPYFSPTCIRSRASEITDRAGRVRRNLVTHRSDRRAETTFHSSIETGGNR